MATKAKPAHRKACSRCRKRKIRCDAALPSCQACARVGARCMGYDPDPDMNEGPRSLVFHLEEEVAALEVKLRALEGAAVDTVSGKLQSSLAQRQLAVSKAIEYATQVDDGMSLNNHDALVQSTARLAFQANASRLPLPFTYQQSAQVKAKPRRAIPVHRVPRTAAELLLRNYTEIHLPQYPCISEVDLSSAFDRCTEHEGTPSSFEIFIVSMAMAISASTMLWKHEDNALATSAGFWTAAKAQLEQPDITQNEAQQLECCLLMTHYGFTNPGSVDVWYCIGDAVRICLQLGYNQDAGIESGLNDADIDSRRRLFWTTCAMEWSVCAYTRIPPTLGQEFIATKYPSSLSDRSIQMGLTEMPGKKASAWHMLRFRQLEIEVLENLFFYSTSQGPDDEHWSYEGWSADITDRLKIYHDQSLVFAGEHKIEFRNVQYNYLRGRIHRPTPRVPQPTLASRLICIESAMALEEDYRLQQQRGRLFYPWHAGHILFEAAIYLLDTVWTCYEWVVDLDYCQNIIACIRSYPNTIRKMRMFWPAIELCAGIIDELSEPVLLRLEKTLDCGAGSSGVMNSQNDQATSIRIAEYLFPIAEIGIESIGHEKQSSDQRNLVDFSFDVDDLDMDGVQFNMLDFDDIIAQDDNLTQQAFDY